MSKTELLVKEQNENTENYDANISIQRCEHDEENPYAQISRALIRDTTISPECRWMIIYFLSMRDGWTINMTQLIKHLQPHMGRNKVYDLVNEAIDAGYMKREEIKTSKGKGSISTSVKYFVSEKPKFKKCFRRFNFRDTEIRDPENRDIKNKHRYKKEHIEEITNTPPIPPQIPDEPPKQDAAIAAEERENISSKPKKIKASVEFSEEVKHIAQKMVNALHEANPDWLIPKNLHPIMQQIHEMMTLENRSPEKIINIFMWAISDSFWMDKFFKPNPAKYLRQQFGQLSAKMNAKPPANPNKIDRRPRKKDGSIMQDHEEYEF